MHVRKIGKEPVTIPGYLAIKAIQEREQKIERRRKKIENFRSSFRSLLRFKRT
jgi:hypothetical protein